MQRLIRRRTSLLLLAAITALTVGLALLYLYLCDTDTVGVWTAVTNLLLDLAILFPIFFGLSVAFRRAAQGNLRSAVGLLGLVLAASFTHQSVIAFFDYLIYSGFVAWAAVLFGLLGGLISGLLHTALLLTILFSIPYLLFLRGENDAERGILYAGIAASIGYLLYRLLQEAVSILTFLSEHLWIANRSEILSFVLYSAFDILLSAAAFGFFLLARRLSLKTK